MQQTHAKRKVGGKHNRKFERRSRNRQPHTAASSFRLCGFHRKNHKKTIPAHKIWISSIAQSMFCKLWSSPLAQVSESGASLTCWKDTETTIRGLMHTVNKEADHKTQTRTAAPPLFRTAKGEIAKQAAAVNGQDERATPAVDSRRLFCFAADKAVKPKSA